MSDEDRKREDEHEAPDISELLKQAFLGGPVDLSDPQPAEEEECDE